MKRIFPSLLILFIFIFSSCSNSSHDLLWYQAKSIRAECTLNGEYKIIISKDSESASVTVSSPSELEGISFEINDEQCLAKTPDGIKMPIDRSSISGICALTDIFSLNEESIIKTEPAENGSAIYTFSENGVFYEMTYGKNSTPKHVKILSENISYDIEINAIEIK